ncbi:response regulator [Streptomyces sp. NPDC046374]|uniref:response regulator n=1 Tax=unclassified Streptomyces TaxID=2593676 RepID=UPI0034110CD5
MTRVLLIEDDPAVRKGVTLALRRRGHEIETAASGETGLLALERAQPDLVLLDLMLPGMSGLEVCRRIRETRQIPIIVRVHEQDLAGAWDLRCDASGSAYPAEAPTPAA